MNFFPFFPLFVVLFGTETGHGGEADLFFVKFRAGAIKIRFLFLYGKKRNELTTRNARRSRKNRRRRRRKRKEEDQGCTAAATWRRHTAILLLPFFLFYLAIMLPPTFLFGKWLVGGRGSGRP